MPQAIRSLVLSALGAIALQWHPMATAQQAYPSFREVDFFYSQQPQVFRNLWQTAQSQTIRIAVLGDSQETSPNSHGFQYIPLLNHELWKRFGNSPETPVAGCFFYGTTPPANWLLAGACGTPGPTATRLSASQILPNARPRAFSTLNSATNVTGGSRGQLTMLQHDAIDVDPSAGIATNVSYFNTSGTVKARIFAATNTSSGEIGYQARPNDLHSPSYSAGVTTTGTITLGLQSPSFAIRSAETAPLHFNGKRYMALEVFGTSDTQLTDLIGLRFVNETHPEGVVVDSFSLGGYTASTFLTAHADAGAMFAAFGFHAAIVHYGANEGDSLTAEQFRSNVSAVISRVRGWAGDASFPIVLIADVYQDRLTPGQMAEYDRYVGAQLAIAQADPNVMVINARRLTEDIGWNAASGQSSQYLDDGIHYTALGAKTLSSAAVAAMMGEIHASGCPGDPDSVTLQSSMKLVVDLGGTSACTNHGQLTIAQTLTLNQPILEVKLVNGFTPAAGDQFKILSFATAAGSFGSMSLPTLPPELSWNADDLYSTGTLEVIATPAPPTTPPPPPALPNPPTISVTSGRSQSVTLPNSPSPIAFTLSGSGSLTVAASSSNEPMLPSSAIIISAGCGTESLTCTATLAPVSGQSGSSTVSLTVSDTHGQSGMASATLQVNPAAPSQPGTGGGAGSENKRGGGGGSFNLVFVLLLSLASLAGSRPYDYSCRKASMGARLAARRAGRIPNNMPTSAENPVAPTTAHHGTAGGGKCGMIFAANTPSSQPNPMPMMPPSTARTIASIRNCMRMKLRGAPNALAIPISRVRSVTDTSMMFMIPTPPTSNEMPTTAEMTSVMVPDTR
jgi:hypothetical protein